MALSYARRATPRHAAPAVAHDPSRGSGGNATPGHLPCVSMSTASQAPVHVEIVPGQLRAAVYAHALESQQGTIACWSYVTEGLAAQGQAELVFTLRRDADESPEGFPAEPLQLFSTVHALAGRGQRVGPGGVTEFGEQRLFDHHLLYAAAQPMAGVALPEPCLAALLVTPDELRAVRAFGPSRVLARMGQAMQFYPFPPWSDRRRSGLALARTFELSLLSQIARALAQGVHVGVVDERIVMSVLRSEQGVWRERLAQLPESAPVALLTAIDPAANGCLTWVPGQKGPEAIVPPGSDGTRVCGCFVVFVSEQLDSGGRILEDGLAMQLTRDAWQSVRHALCEGEELSIEGTAGMAFSLTWRDAVAPRPAELGAPSAGDDAAGGTSAGAGAGEGSAGEGKAAAAGGAVALGPVRLLTPEAEFAARASAGDLAAFCHGIQRCAERLLAGQRGPLALRLQVICEPQGHRIGLSHKGDIADEALDRLIDALEQLAPPPVRGEVSFEIELSLADGPRDFPG
jgi:hypothetical protein